MSASVEELITQHPDVSIIDPSTLLPGDIIFSTGDGIESWLIRSITLSQVSHVALHIGSGLAIEANDPGVVPVYLPFISQVQPDRMRVRRLSSLTQQQRLQIVNFVLSLLYRPYSTIGAVSTIIPVLRRQKDPGLFCSQLVGAAYQDVGAPLVSHKCPAEITPADLLKTEILGDMPEAIKRIPTLHHRVITERAGRVYTEYLAKGNEMARLATTFVNENIVAPPLVAGFNIFDFARQLEGATANAERSKLDGLLCGFLLTFSNGKTEAPFPSVNFISSLVNAGKHLEGDLIWRKPFLKRDNDFCKYNDQFLANLLTALSFEDDLRRSEIAGFMEAHKRTGLLTYASLGAWGVHDIERDNAYRRQNARSSNSLASLLGSIKSNRKKYRSGKYD
jgi:uncharacterized protein YycO